ncbi:uncharacterized protein LOC132556532 [Ylistrum balloti]|uniref:uncharacterized protein LOC132552403 n=1 Tax=Ylistrum balloti TaxID=509963 RepID=UPI002905BC54|nr:uncharacterized protein LOC132552403 [Ylistrum balloti]XP_060076928.1 uncharacterized protein LOC132556532 [Ylistrum balloti]
MTTAVVHSRVIRSERSTSSIPYGLNSPCGPSISGAPLPSIRINQLKRDDIIPHVEEAQRITDQLREHYDGIPPPDVYSEEVVGLPGPQDISTYRNVTVDYTVVSHLLVFVDIVCNDDGPVLWQRLRSRILHILCGMYRTMVNVKHISEDITLPCVVEASCGSPRSSFARNRRNFVIFSAVRDVLSRLYETYSALPGQ